MPETAVALHDRLMRLIQDWESELVEFKDVSDSYSTDLIGKYFSALANEANIRNESRAWLIFGVNDKTREIVSSSYRLSSERLNGLKHDVCQSCDPRVTFCEIHELYTDQGRVILFEIPAAPMGIPIAWKGHYYARAGESLVNLGLDKLDTIRTQGAQEDWSATVVVGAGLHHLDPVAVHAARMAFTQKYRNRFAANEVAAWTDAVFCDRAKITIEGQITRSALLLLGQAEAAHFLSPHPAQMTWKLEGEERAYEHFSPPFLLTTSTLYQRIRNIQMRILPENTLFPIEVSKYEQKIVLEALHNCIAHQDYTRNGRILVTERVASVLFENEGNFFDGLPDEYMSGNKTPRRYRNAFLVQAMTELNMIDTMGYGIHEMYSGQARRCFPLPDYDLTDEHAVSVTLHGSIVDPAYTQILIQRTDLSLPLIVALDRIQKKMSVDAGVLKQLRGLNLIEGRKPNIHISADLAEAINEKVAYIRTRSQDDHFYKQLILDFIEKFGSATRQDVSELLHDKLSDALSDDQKNRKITYLLTGLRRMGKLHNTGTRKDPVWKGVCNEGES